MIAFFAKHPTLANLLMLAFVVMGLTSVSSLRRETFPDFSSSMVEARVIYPGATAEDVEEAVCQRLEDAIDSVSDVEEVITEAREGVGIVTAEMTEGGDVVTFLNDMKTEVEAIDDFPDECEAPVIRQVARTDPVVSIAVTGPMSTPDLKAYCEGLKRRLQRREGVSLVAVEGFSEHQFRIEIPALTLMQYGLSVSDIASAVGSQNVNMPAGLIETRDGNYQVRFTDERRSVSEYADLVVIGAATGGEIRLGEIATITDLFELDEDKIVFNGQRAGRLAITKTKSEDALTIYDEVTAFVEEEQARAPAGVNYHLTRDISSIMRDRLQMLLKNGAQGLLLVFLVMWLFFTFRLSFWVAVGLPISFLGAFYFFPVIGYSINMITMVGLLLALGLLMDDAIVIAENVASHLARGKTSLRAAIDGVNEVKVGVLFSFLTTISVFGPLCFMEGHIGKVMRVMPGVLILVLAVSLVEAFLILPRHLAHSLHGHQADRIGVFRRKFNAAIDWLRDGVLGRAVDWTVEWRYLTLGLSMMILVMSVSLIAGGVIKFQVFPEIDGDVVEVRLLLPAGTPLERTEQAVAQLTSALERVNESFKPRQPDGQDLVKYVSVAFNSNADAKEAGPHVATVAADLLAADVRDARLDDVMNLWREETGVIADLVALRFTQPTIGPGGKAIKIRFLSDDLGEMDKAAHFAMSWFRQFEGVEDLFSDLRKGKPELRLRLKDGAVSLGVNARQIASQLRGSFHGVTADEVQIGPESYEIDVRMATGDRDSLADLAYFHVATPAGQLVPLSTLADLELSRSYSRMSRIDGQRAVTVEGEVDARVANASDLTRRFIKTCAPEIAKRFPNVKIDIEGQRSESRETGGSLLKALSIGVIAVFILLSFEFRSYVEPLVVMIAIPLAFIGVIIAHWALGLDLTMPSMIGYVSLCGIVVNDSILLVAFLKNRRREGMEVAEAARRASRERFRAVLLTSLTTVAGLLPLLSETSLQAQILIPLAASLVGGIMASTVLVLLVVPALYVALGDFNLIASVDQGEE